MKEIVRFCCTIISLTIFALKFGQLLLFDNNISSPVCVCGIIPIEGLAVLRPIVRSQLNIRLTRAVKTALFLIQYPPASCTLTRYHSVPYSVIQSFVLDQEILMDTLHTGRRQFM